MDTKNSVTNERVKTKYRPLVISEREMLFALYDKHNGNILAMTRDSECFIKGKNQLYYYRDFYHFAEELGKFREKRAKEITSSLQDSKILAIEHVIRLLETRQMPLRAKDGSAILDTNSRPIFIEIEPNYKEIKTAWEIIKTELGEPTSVSAQHITPNRQPVIPSAEQQEMANKALEEFLRK